MYSLTFAHLPQFTLLHKPSPVGRIMNKQKRACSFLNESGVDVGRQYLKIEIDQMHQVCKNWDLNGIMLDKTNRVCEGNIIPLGKHRTSENLRGHRCANSRWVLFFTCKEKIDFNFSHEIIFFARSRNETRVHKLTALEVLLSCLSIDLHLAGKTPAVSPLSDIFNCLIVKLCFIVRPSWYPFTFATYLCCSLLPRFSSLEWGALQPLEGDPVHSTQLGPSQQLFCSPRSILPPAPSIK